MKSHLATIPMKVKMPGQFISGKESKQELNEHMKIKVNFVLAMQQIDGTETFRKNWFGRSLDSKPLKCQGFSTFTHISDEQVNHLKNKLYIYKIWLNLKMRVHLWPCEGGSI